jgi:hypothetical protein
MIDKEWITKASLKGLIAIANNRRIAAINQVKTSFDS